MTDNGLYKFGEFEFDAEEFALTRDGVGVSLTPKMFEVLQLLIERRGRIVSKDDLMNAVWPDSVVEESNLAVTIRQLRKALNDDAHNPKFIETIPRRGYRFKGEVEHHDALNEPRDQYRKSHPQVIGPPIRSSRSVVSLADWQRPDELIPSETSANKDGPSDAHKLGLVPSNSRLASGRRNRGFVIAGVIALAVLVGAAYSLYRMFGPDSAIRSSPTRLTTNGKTKTAAISPDGKFIAYVVDDEGTQSLWLKNVATESDVQILQQQEKVVLGSVVFSPDGNNIYYGASTKLYQLPILGGTRKEILQEYTGSIQHNEITFSPDGKRFVFVQNWSDPVTISVANADGTDEQPISDGAPLADFVHSASWSPDGKTIACVGRTREDVFAIFIVGVEDKRVSELPTPRWSHVYQAAWQRDGKALLVVATGADNEFLPQIWRVSYPDGDAKKLIEDSNGYSGVSLTADGRDMLAVRSQQNAHVWVMPSDDTSQARQLTTGFDRNDGVFNLEWLNDNKLVYGSAPEGKLEFWLSDHDGQNAKQLLIPMKTTGRAATDGQVIFQEENGKGIALQQHEIDGIGWRRLITSIPEAQAVLSPDNKWIVFNRFNPFSALWKISIDGGEPQKLTERGYAVSPSLSPDGTLIAYYGRSEGGHPLPEIRIISIDGGEPIQRFSTTVKYSELSRKSSNLQWTPDGRSLNFNVFKNGVSNIWRQPIDGSQLIQVTHFLQARIFNYSYSPDGKRLALSRGTLEHDAVLFGNINK